MEQVTRSLPLRLIPTKGSQALPIVAMMVLLGVVGFVALNHNPMTLVQKNGPIGYLYHLLFAVFILIPIGGLVVSVLKLLPGSPYYHLEIAPRGIVIRQGFTTKRFAWSEVSPFAVHIEVVTTRGKNGRKSTSTYYYVVAVPAADEALLQDKAKRLSRSVFRVVAGEYGVGSEEEDANALASWLTEVRSNALVNSGRTKAQVAVPPEFRGTVMSVAVKPTSSLATKSGVIER
jgi:hypothetical protein